METTTFAADKGRLRERLNTFAENANPLGYTGDAKAIWASDRSKSTESYYVNVYNPLTWAAISIRLATHNGSSADFDIRYGDDIDAAMDAVAEIVAGW